MAAITEDEIRHLKQQYILATAGQRVLTYTLQCGMPGKPSTVTLLQYLSNLPQGSTANYIRDRNPSGCFNKTDLRQINGDPSCTKFDVTLLHKAIKLACENVAGPHEMVSNVNVWTSPTPLPGNELEYFTTKIKDSRNAVVHEGQPLDETAFQNEVTTLRALFDSCLRATKDRYARDDAEYRAERAVVLAKVTDIQQEALGMEEMLQRSAASMLPVFKLETDQELRTRLDSARYLTPLHFLSGISEPRVEVSDIFCDITLTEERGAASQGDPNKVPYLEILRLCEGATVSTVSPGPLGRARPQVLVVEGEAGSGKTTLATLLLQQWFMPQDRRRMQGLEHYDLLLRVACRERSNPTLEDLVRQLMPESHIRYRRLLLPLLKKCRILVIIDGIDEVNDVSRMLVANILSEAAATTFTIVCTSRPHTVEDLKAEARCMHFQVFHVRMLGVSEMQRLELAMRHYMWLCDGANTAANTDALRWAAQDIIWREVFRLPLNLLFLATLFFYEPHRVSISLSQRELYQYFHTWCREKLQAKLGAPSQAVRGRQGPVDRVLAVIYEVALKGLLQDRVCLNNQDLQDVEVACTIEGLDQNAVLSAFFCLQREINAGVVMETYEAPHKSLLEYMAAKGIAGQVRLYSEGAIEHVLRRYTVGQDPPLGKLQHMLIHLLSLLTRQGDAMKEAADLLCQSGLSRTNTWLGLLTDAMAPDAVVKHVAEQLVAGGLEDEQINIWENNARVASMMLQHLPQQKVEVELWRELTDVDNLGRVLARHRVTRLLLRHHWRHPHQQAASATLLRGAERSDLWSFRGHLNSENLALLPLGLRDLYLVVRDSCHAQTLLPTLAMALPTLPQLETITLHIPAAAVTPADITRLPARPALNLYLSGVTDQLAEAAGDIVAAVCPPENGCVRMCA